MSECPICLDQIENNFIITTPCKHSFCIKCFLKLFETTCPLCRKQFRNSLPPSILAIILKNSRSERPNSNFNIFNQHEFPPLN